MLLANNAVRLQGGKITGLAAFCFTDRILLISKDLIEFVYFWVLLPFRHGFYIEIFFL